MRIQSSQALLPLLVVALSSLSACVDEKVVFDDPGDDTGEIPANAGGFVGYQDANVKLTFCGTCHMDSQEAWRATKHADAWMNFGGGDETAQLRHSTNQLGNVATVPSGYAVTPGERYEDVQCEACHGPGLEHINAPANANIPQAPLAAGTLLSTGCGECHRSADSPFLEEWVGTGHALGVQSKNPSCTGCHSGDGALMAWGVNSEWAEKGVGTGFVNISCAVCHDPHGSENVAYLRKSPSATNLDANLCMTCHQRRAVPELNSLVGPHSPEGPTLLGTAGWWPEGAAKVLVSTHGTPEANEKLCVTCHVHRFDVRDASGATVYASTGHTFEATPCLDSSGRPIVGGNCTDEQRSYKSCTGAGCHGNEGVARAATSTTTVRVNRLLAELKALLDQVPSSELNSSDPTITPAEGATFNRELAVKSGSAVHNPLLLEQLLITSIEELQRAYGLSLATGVDLTPSLDHSGS